MLRTWDGFMEFLRDNGCEQVDGTDWGYPIWRSEAGRFAGLDLNKDLDDFMICAICDALLIDPPAQHNGVQPLVKDIKKAFPKKKR